MGRSLRTSSRGEARRSSWYSARSATTGCGRSRSPTCRSIVVSSPTASGITCRVPSRARRPSTRYPLTPRTSGSSSASSASAQHTSPGTPTAGAWPPWWLETIRSWFEAWCSSSRRCTRYYLSVPRLGRFFAERGVAMAGVQAALDAGDPAAAVRRFLDFTLAPAGFGGLSPEVQAVMLANAHVLPLLLRGAPAPFTCADAGRISMPTLLVTGERTLRLFALTTDELESACPGASGSRSRARPTGCRSRARHVCRSGAPVPRQTVGEPTGEEVFLALALAVCYAVGCMSWSLKEKADRLLSQETGTIRKEWGGRVSFALVYPNTYAVGMSNLGFQTIYRHLNALPDVVCERVFLPDPEDLPEYRRTGTGPFSLESKRPLAQFDLVGFSITYEGDYINTLRLLRMAGIPLRPENRQPEDPDRPDGRRVRLREPGARGPVHGLRGGRRGRGDRRGDRRRRTARPSARCRSPPAVGATSWTASRRFPASTSRSATPSPTRTTARSTTCGPRPACRLS